MKRVDTMYLEISFSLHDVQKNKEKARGTPAFFFVIEQKEHIIAESKCIEERSKK